jgi:purine-cytosine permease-like protein
MDSHFRMKELVLGLLRVAQALAVVFGIMLLLWIPPTLMAGEYGRAAIGAVIAAPILYFLYPRPKGKRPPV